MKRMAMAAGVAALALSLTGPAAAQPAQKVIGVWYDLNEACRGGSGDTTEDICTARDKLTNALNDLGQCYGKRGQSGAEMKWHRCEPRSLRAGS